MSTPPRRAAPLAPAERRARIIATTLPLLRRYGKDVTTAQIALAAGVAEGTLFRAFPDKDSLIAAALETAFDAEPTERELAAIDPALDLRAKLIAGVEILQRRIERSWQLMAMFNMQVPVTTERWPVPNSPQALSDERIRIAMLGLFAGHADELRCDPAYATRIVRMLAFAASHPRIAAGEPLTSSEIVAAVLDGVRVRANEDLEQPEPS